MKNREHFLFVAIVDGEWSHKADEFFLYERIILDGKVTQLCEIYWRHGPGISNRQ